MVKTTKPSSLAFAVRDGTPFANLKDDAVEALAVTVTGYEKALTELVAKLAETPTPPAQNGATDAPAATEATPSVDKKTPIVPDVIPPKAARGVKTQGS